MTTAQLITIARKCGERATKCKDECPMYSYNANCVTRLLNALADELEKSEKYITVGNGENYEVTRNG